MLSPFEKWTVAVEAHLYTCYGRLLKDTRGLGAGVLVTWWADQVSAVDAAKRLRPYLVSERSC